MQQSRSVSLVNYLRTNTLAGMSEYKTPVMWYII